jgi:cytochrome c
MRRAFLFALLGACSSPSRTVDNAAPAPPRFSIGKAVSDEDLRAWPTIHPDGRGLPNGRGSVADGALVYAARCARCHGATSIEGPLDVLAGRAPSEGYRLGARPPGAQPVTIGNWWPRAPSLFDYLRRAMPADAPGTLSDDDTYALCAFLLHKNDIVPADAVLDAASLAEVKMPAKANFVVDR